MDERHTDAASPDDGASRSVVLVGRLSGRERARLGPTLFIVLGSITVAQLTVLAGRALLPDELLVLVFPVIVLLPVTALLVARARAARRFRGFEVVADGRRVRTHDGRVHDADEVRTAELEIIAEPRRLFRGYVWRTVLRLVFSDGHSVRLLLREDDRLVLVEEERAALLAFLERTDPEVPRPPEDPNGRFAGVRYTGRMTRDEVLRLVERPPGRDDPFPAPA